MSRPDVFADIAAVIGLPAAVKLAEMRGGGRMTVPARTPARHWLVDLLGRETADALCAHYRTLSPEGTERGVEIDMPHGPVGVAGAIRRAQREMAEALEAGESADTAARRSGMSRRSAYRMKKRKTDRRQLSLF